MLTAIGNLDSQDRLFDVKKPISAVTPRRMPLLALKSDYNLRRVPQNNL